MKEWKTFTSRTYVSGMGSELSRGNRESVVGSQGEELVKEGRWSKGLMVKDSGEHDHGSSLNSATQPLIFRDFGTTLF